MGYAAYVIFKGPKTGVFSDWDDVADLILLPPPWDRLMHHKGYRSLQEAQEAYREALRKPGRVRTYRVPEEFFKVEEPGKSVLDPDSLFDHANQAEKSEQPLLTLNESHAVKIITGYKRLAESQYKNHDYKESLESYKEVLHFIDELSQPMPEQLRTMKTEIEDAQKRVEEAQLNVALPSPPATPQIVRQKKQGAGSASCCSVS